MGTARRTNSDVAVPWTSPSLQVILGTTLISMMGITLISPALPAIRDAFAITDTQTSLVITAFTVPSIFLAPGIGLLADRFGRRRVLIPSLVVFGLSGGGIVLAPDFHWLLAFRFVQGIAASGMYALALTLIGDFYSGVQRNAVMGASHSVLQIGTTMYPIVGGALATVVWFAPFSVFFLGVVVGFFALVALEEPTGERAAFGVDYLREAFRTISIREAVVVYGLLLATIVTLYGAALTALPFMLERTFGLSSFLIGIPIGAKSFTAAVVSTQNGRLARRFSNIEIAGIGFLGFGLGLFAVWAAPAAVYVVAAMVVFGAGQGLLFPSLDTAVTNLAPTQFRAGVTSLRMSTQKLGQTIGPLLFTVAAVATGYGTLMLIAGVLTTTLAVLLLWSQWG